MKVIAIQSSPNINGLTSSLAQAVFKGVGSEEGKTELILLNRLDMKPCTAYEKGWVPCRTEGACILEDDFEALREKIAEADTFVFATPVYWHDISESAKIFLNRLRRCETFRSFKTFASKRAIGIASAGGSGRGDARALYNLEVYLRRLGFEIIDSVPVTWFLKDQKIEMLEKVGERLRNS